MKVQLSRNSLRIVLEEFVSNFGDLMNDNEALAELAGLAGKKLDEMQVKHDGRVDKAAEDLLRESWTSLIAIAVLAEATVDAINITEWNLFKVKAE